MTMWIQVDCSDGIRQHPTCTAHLQHQYSFSYLAAPSFLLNIWILNVIRTQICTGESGEPIMEGHKMPGRRNSAQFTALSTGPEMELSCGSLVSWGRNNCLLGKRVLRSGSLSNFLMGRSKMFTDGKVGTFPNSKEKWELCPCSAIQPNKLVDAAAGPWGRQADRHPG